MWLINIFIIHKLLVKLKREYVQKQNRKSQIHILLYKMFYTLSVLYAFSVVCLMYSCITDPIEIQLKGQLATFNLQFTILLCKMYSRK